MTTMKAMLDLTGEKNGHKVTIKKGKEKTESVDPVLSRALINCHLARQCVHGEQEKFTREKALVIARAKAMLGENGTVTFQSQGIEVKVTFGTQCVVLEHRLVDVRAILEARFDDLVNTKTKFTASKKLIGILADADSELGEKLRPFFQIKEAAPLVSVSFTEPPADLPEAS